MNWNELTSQGYTQNAPITLSSIIRSAYINTVLLIQCYRTRSRHLYRVHRALIESPYKTEIPRTVTDSGNFGKEKRGGENEKESI